MTMPDEQYNNDEQEVVEVPVEEQQVVEIPEGQEVPEGYEEVPKTEEAEKPKGELDDLFEVPQEHDSDIETDDLFELDDQDIGVGDEESMDDLFELDGNLGSPHHPKKKKIRKATRRYTNTPTSVRGIGS